MSASVTPDLEEETVILVSLSVMCPTIVMTVPVVINDIFSLSTHIHTNPLDLYPCQNQSLCQNGATCVDDGAGGHMCICSPGYMGASCQTEIDECSPRPCHNGASCTVSV